MKPKYEKIIFLDIDGVLNTGRFTYPQWLIEGDAVEDADGHFFDAECITQLSRILEATKAQIVISSAWRWRGLKKLRALWQNRQIEGDIVDITPTVYGLKTIQKPRFDLILRGDEIKDWLNQNVTKQFVIIDDIDDFTADLQPFYCQTENDKGITKEVADRIIALLNADWKSPFIENRLYRKTKGKRVLYFGIDNILLDEEDIAKTALTNGQLERLLKSCAFDYYACVSGYSDMVVQRHQYIQKPNKTVQKEAVWQLLKDIFTDKNDFIKKLILIYNTDKRGDYINVDSDWYYLDDWADKYFVEAQGIQAFEEMKRHNRIFLNDPQGDGADILQWLAQLSPNTEGV